MSPELKAFKFYKRNIDYYLSLMESFWGDDTKQLEMYNEIAAKLAWQRTIEFWGKYLK